MGSGGGVGLKILQIGSKISGGMSEQIHYTLMLLEECFMAFYRKPF